MVRVDPMFRIVGLNSLPVAAVLLVVGTAAAVLPYLTQISALAAKATNPAPAGASNAWPTPDESTTLCTTSGDARICVALTPPVFFMRAPSQVFPHPIARMVLPVEGLHKGGWLFALLAGQSGAKCHGECHATGCVKGCFIGFISHGSWRDHFDVLPCSKQ